MKDRKQAQTLNGMWHTHLKLTGHTPKHDDLTMTVTRAQMTSTIMRASHSFAIIFILIQP